MFASAHTFSAAGSFGGHPDPSSALGRLQPHHGRLRPRERIPTLSDRLVLMLYPPRPSSGPTYLDEKPEAIALY